MALQFEDIPIPLTAGQASNTDQALINFPEWKSIENGEFADRNSISCVDGVTTLPITSMTGETAPGDVNTSTRRLLTHKDELLLETWAGIFRQQVNGSFALAAGSNNRKREALRFQRAAVTSIQEAQASQADDWAGAANQLKAGLWGTDAAQLGEYTCVVWVEPYGAAGQAQVAWQIRHRTSDAIVGRGRIRDSAGVVKEPRVIAFNNQFRIFAIGQGGFARIGYLFIDPTSTQNVSESLTLLPGSVGNNTDWFDIATSPTSYCVSAVDNVALQMGHLIFKFADPTALAFSQYFAVGVTAHLGNAYIDSGGSGFGTGFVGFYVQSATGTIARWSGITTAGAAIPVAATAALSWTLRRLFPVKSYSGSPTTWPVLVDATNASGHLITSLIYNATAASPGTVAQGATIVEHHIVAGLPCSTSGSSYTGVEGQGFILPTYYAPATTSSVNRTTHQVLDIARSLTRSLASGGEVCYASVLRVFDAGLFYNEQWSGSAFYYGRVCTSIPVALHGGSETAAYTWCPKFTPNITDVNNLGTNPTNIQRNTIDYEEPVGSIEFADLTYFAGGTPLVYDGQDVFEEGFTLAPEVVSVVAAAAAGPLAVGTYSIVFVYEWFDGQGNRWQSRPSGVATFTTTPGNLTYTATVRALVASLKGGVQIVPYRTTVAGGTIFYRDSPVGVTPLSDTALQNSELLYTGGVLTRVGTEANDALPSVKQFCVHQNRLVAVGGEFERGFFYSKERSPRFPAEFNRASGFGQVPEATGPVSAGASIDDKLVLFATNGLSVIFGQGPSFNWTQNGYSTPVQIQSAEGIRADTPFVALVPEGVWYVTSAGPRMLTRGLATARDAAGLDLGDKIRNADQQYVGQCQAVFTHPTKPQVYFCASDGSAGRRVYIYNYLLDRWSYRNDIGDYAVPATGWAVARGTVYYVTTQTIANNPLRYIDPTVGGSTTVYLMSGWFSFAGLQRFQRWTDLQVVGGTLTKGIGATYSVEFVLYTDYDESTSVQNSTATSIAMTGANRQWQVDFQIQRQKAAAFKVVLGVTATVASKSNNFSLTGLLATVGLKRGGAKLPAAQRG